MIICLYHGSSFKNVNEEQTKPVTKVIKDYFSNEEVIEAYYSDHVCEKLWRREQINMHFKKILNKVYDKNNEIKILITNMIDGEEYQQILNDIKAIDYANKIKFTKPLLDKTTIYDIVEILVDKSRPIVHVGHGSNQSEDDYQFLNEILEEDGNYAITLKTDFKKFLNNNIMDKQFIIRTLMFTSGYHVKLDIEKKLVEIAKTAGYNPQVISDGLCKESKIIEILINNLLNLSKEKKEL